MSEFGRGYAICLIQFIYHEPRLAEDRDLYAQMAQENPGLFSDTDAAEIWANGSADHLFDLIRPRRWIDVAHWRQAKAFQARMLDARLSYRGQKYSTADMEAALAEARSLLSDFAAAAHWQIPTTFDEAMTLDEAAGLRPQRGDSATCEGPIPLRRGRS